VPERPASVPLSAEWSEPDQEWVVGERDAAGELVGDVTYYRPDGSMVCICSHAAGRPHGQSRRFHESGEVSQVAQYVDGVLHGTRILYATDGPTTEKMHAGGMSAAVAQAEFDYVNGNLRTARYIDRDGRRVTVSGQPLPDRPAGVPDTALFDDRSQKWVDGEYDSDGEPVGTGLDWSRDGTPLQRLEHLGDGMTRRIGLYENGRTRLVRHVRDGVLVGRVEAWRRDGTPMRRAHVHANAFAGPIVEFDATGSPIQVDRVVTSDQAAPLNEPLDPMAVHDLASPVGMSHAIVVGWCGDADRDAAQARTARRSVWAAAPSSLRARLTSSGLDRPARLTTAKRLARVVADLGQDPSIDENALFAAAAVSGETGVALALSSLAPPAQACRIRPGGRLALDHLGLTEAPDGIGNIPELTELDLSANELRTVPVVLGRLIQLHELKLDGNCIEELPADLTRLTELRSLSLSDNALTTLPAGLLDLGELTRLSLGDNDLRELPKEFATLSRLDALWLHDNPLSSLPTSMTQLTQLTFLHLGNVAWEEPPACLFEMPSLEELWLAGPSLRRIPPALCRLPRLRRLHVWYSNLSEVPDEMFEMTGLEELRIRHNPLPAGVIGRLRDALPNCTIY
jgi:antitoxin component YwqK of YwqJK toxin-antitoxin module